MKLEVTISGAELLEIIYDEIGTDFDGIGEFAKSLSAVGGVVISGDVDRYSLEEEVTDEWIEKQYLERFDGGDYRDDRDEKAGLAELQSGNPLIARALFSRAGRDDLAGLVHVG